MTISALTAKPVLPTGETRRAILDWLRQARIAATLPGQADARPGPFQDEPARIAEHVDRGAVELGLLGLGWQPPRAPRRR